MELDISKMWACMINWFRVLALAWVIYQICSTVFTNIISLSLSIERIQSLVVFSHYHWSWFNVCVPRHTLLASVKIKMCACIVCTLYTLCIQVRTRESDCSHSFACSFAFSLSLSLSLQCLQLWIIFFFIYRFVYDSQFISSINHVEYLYTHF